jgi:ABC-2 type transport system ATP-binding protein
MVVDIAVVDLTKKFPSRREGVFGLGNLLDRIRGRAGGVVALRNMDLKVGAGEFHCLLGPNGAGKTTLCKILNALVLPDQGDVKICGLDAVRNHRQIASFSITAFGGERSMWGLMTPRLTIDKNLRYLAALWQIPKNELNDRITFALKTLDLEEKRYEWYQKLSAGQQQKSAMALPLMLKPRVMILDEPTIKMDVKSRQQLYQVLKEHFNQQLGTTILYTTHNMQEAEKLADKITIIHSGEVVYTGSVEKAKEKVRQGKHVNLTITPKTKPNNRPFVKPFTHLQRIFPNDARISKNHDTACIQFLLKDSRADIAPQLEKLAEAGYEIQQINTGQVSLEEAFLTLTREDTKMGG